MHQQDYSCTYEIFWSEMSKIEGQKLFSDHPSADSYVSFAIAYLLRIKNIFSEFSKTNTDLYPWTVGKFNLDLNPSVTCWNDISLIGTYCNFSINDEAQIWNIVFEPLLYISEQVPELIISAKDNFYGNFLLASCGNSIPSWIINDDVALNRTFIQGGRFHLIPRELLSSKKDVLLEDAIAAISSPMTITLMNKKMEAVLLDSLSSSLSRIKIILSQGPKFYPILVPEKIAFILSKFSFLIPITCECFNANIYKTTPNKFSHITREFDEYFKQSKNVTISTPLTQKCFALLEEHPLPEYISIEDNTSSIIGAKIVWGFLMLLSFVKKFSNPKVHYSAQNVDEARTYAKLLFKQKTFGEDYLDDLNCLRNPLAIEDANIRTCFAENDNFDYLQESSTGDKWLLSTEDLDRLVHYSQDNFDPNFVDNNSFEACSSDTGESDGLDNHSEYDEFEVLDTLSRDPELLMRVLEKYSDYGDSVKALISKISKLVVNRSESSSSDNDSVKKNNIESEDIKNFSSSSLSSDDENLWEYL